MKRKLKSQVCINRILYLVLSSIKFHIEIFCFTSIKNVITGKFNLELSILSIMIIILQNEQIRIPFALTIKSKIAEDVISSYNI